MKLTGFVLAAAVVALGAGSTPARAQASDPAVDKLVADWTAAFAKGDARALASLYTDTAVRSSQDGGTTIGRAAIEKEFAANFTGPWKGATIKITPGSHQAVSADVAVNAGTWVVSGTGPDGQAMTMKGRYVNTIVKKGGAWLLASNAAIVDAPPAR
jgi:uncharacterized protein (TIGR02246 family)